MHDEAGAALAGVCQRGDSGGGQALRLAALEQRAAVHDGDAAHLRGSGVQGFRGDWSSS